MQASKIYTLSTLAIVIALGLSTVHADEGSKAPISAELAAAIKAEARERSEVMKHLHELCDGIGPRLTGSTNITKAADWAVKKFESFGIKAHQEEWGRWDVIFDRGEHRGLLHSPGKEPQALSFGTNSWTPGTNGPRRGAAVLAPTTVEEVKALGDSLEGAWLVARSLPRMRLMPNRRLDEALAKAGIAGYLQPVRGELIVTGGSVRDSEAAAAAPVQVRIIESEWKSILSRLEAGEKLELEFDIQNFFKPGPAIHTNVIAEIPGSERPDEVVIIGAHLDSWDGARGAIDNGCGVATTIEAARILSAAKVKPKRTIRFMLYSGEEQGLLGSRAWVKAHRSEWDKISAVLVHDGGTNVCSGINVTGAQFESAKAAFASVIDDGHEFPFKVERVMGLRGGASDHDSFLAVGIPGYFWNQSGRAIYSYAHHTQHDKPDQVIPEYQRRSAEVIATGALGIANLPSRLSRDSLLDMMNRPKTLGVQLDGLKITEVVPGSIADKAGFQPGDVILEGGGKPINSMEWLRAAIRAAEGSTVFKVQRGDKEVSLTADFPKEAPKPKMLGIRLDGMTITEITPDSIAEKAGMESGDKIVAGGGRQLIMFDELREVIQNATGKVVFKVERGGETIELVADFGEAEAPKKPKKFY